MCSSSFYSYNSVICNSKMGIVGWTWANASLSHATQPILEDPGADSGGEGKSKRAEKYGTKKSKERRKEPLGTMSDFWLVPENFFVFLPIQKAERRRPFGTGLLRHCPQGLFSPFFIFLRTIFFCPFRLSLAPTICPWVSEDELNRKWGFIS